MAAVVERGQSGLVIGDLAEVHVLRLVDADDHGGEVTAAVAVEVR